MAYTVLYATGFEARGQVSQYTGTQTGWDFQFYLEHGWVTTAFYYGLSTTASTLHRSITGSGGSVSFEVGNFGAGTRTPFLGPTARWLNFALIPNGATTRTLYFLDATANHQCAIAFDSLGRVLFYRSNVLLQSSATGVVSQLQNSWIAIYMRCDPAVGEVRVFVNGVEVAGAGPGPVGTPFYSGNTAYTGVADWQSVGFGLYSTFDLGRWYGFIDDLVITDDDGGTITTAPPFPEVFGVPQVPNTVVSGTLTPSTGLPADRWGNVNNINPIQTTTYNEATIPGQEDLYGITPISVAPAAIWGVSVWTRSQRDGAISTEELRVVSGASDTYGTPLLLPAGPSYDVDARFFGQDPAGGVWTQVAVDALQVGIRFS